MGCNANEPEFEYGSSGKLAIHPPMRYQDDPCNEFAPGDDFVKFESFSAKIVFARRLAGSLECGGNDGC